MKKRVNIYEAKTHLSELINKVCETGETYTICKNNKPVVDVVVHKQKKKKKGKLSGPLPEFDGKGGYVGDPFESTEDLWPEEYR
jgi:prevent-host-death family protein